MKEEETDKYDAETMESLWTPGAVCKVLELRLPTLANGVRLTSTENDLHLALGVNLGRLKLYAAASRDSVRDVCARAFVDHAETEELSAGEGLMAGIVELQDLSKLTDEELARHCLEDSFSGYGDTFVECPEKPFSEIVAQIADGLPEEGQMKVRAAAAAAQRLDFEQARVLAAEAKVFLTAGG